MKLLTASLFIILSLSACKDSIYGTYQKDCSKTIGSSKNECESERMQIELKKDRMIFSMLINGERRATSFKIKWVTPEKIFLARIDESVAVYSINKEDQTIHERYSPYDYKKL